MLEMYFFFGGGEGIIVGEPMWSEMQPEFCNSLVICISFIS